VDGLSSAAAARAGWGGQKSGASQSSVLFCLFCLWPPGGSAASCFETAPAPSGPSQSQAARRTLNGVVWRGRLLAGCWTGGRDSIARMQPACPLQLGLSRRRRRRHTSLPVSRAEWPPGERLRVRANQPALACARGLRAKLVCGWVGGWAVDGQRMGLLASSRCAVRIRHSGLLPRPSPHLPFLSHASHRPLLQPSPRLPFLSCFCNPSRSFLACLRQSSTLLLCSPCLVSAKSPCAFTPTALRLEDSHLDSLYDSYLCAQLLAQLHRVRRLCFARTASFHSSPCPHMLHRCFSPSHSRSRCVTGTMAALDSQSLTALSAVVRCRAGCIVALPASLLHHCLPRRFFHLHSSPTMPPASPFTASPRRVPHYKNRHPPASPSPLLLRPTLSPTPISPHEC